MTSPRTDLSIAASVGKLPAHGETITLAVTTSADNSAALVSGQVHQMSCDVDCFVCASATTTADDCTTDDVFLPAGAVILFTVDQLNLYVSAITASGSGTLYISPRTVSAVVSS